MCGLSLRFAKDNQDYVIDHQDYEFFFTEEMFLKLVDNISIRKFHKCKSHIVYDPDLLVKDYSTSIFSKIRVHFNITDLEMKE